jgi:hypothetical protein
MGRCQVPETSASRPRLTAVDRGELALLSNARLVADADLDLDARVTPFLKRRQFGRNVF